MPSASKREELITVLLAKLDKLDADVAGLREMVASRVTAVEAEADANRRTRADWFAQTWPAHLAEHKEMRDQLGSLEETRSQARGAATAMRVLWLAGPLVLGALGTIAAHWVGFVR